MARRRRLPGLAAALLIAGLPGVARSQAADCFDWALVGRVERQVLLGVPAAGPDGIASDAVFRWEVEVREVVAGEGAPRRMTLAAVGHSPLPPQGARQVALFVARGRDGEPRLVRWAVLDRRAGRVGWRGAVTAKANELGAARCAGAG